MRLFAPVLLSITVITACGGNKQRTPPVPVAGSPSATATFLNASPTSRPTVPPSSTAVTSGGRADAERAIGSLFSTVFNSGALGAGTGSASLRDGGGNASLKQYLLKAADYPPGYGSIDEYSTQVPDGISASGTIDIAASVGTQGDVDADDPTGVSVLVSMVMRPQDLQALGESLKSAEGLSDQDLQDAIDSSVGNLGNGMVVQAHVLDASDIGDGGFGMSLSMDLGALLGAFASADGDAPIPKMNMRIFIFAQGDYLGGIVHAGFVDPLPGAAADVALARLLDQKLSSAPSTRRENAYVH